MALDLENVIDFYVNLLIIQYNNKQRARATIDLHIRTLLDDNIICKVQDGFNLDTAVGVQLDVLGRYIGVDRFFSGAVSQVGDFFAMTTYDTLGTDTEVGMTDYANFDTNIGGFITYDDLLITQILNDTDYREILKLKIVQNNSDHSHKSIDDGLFLFFADGLVMSANDNMTMSYFVNNANLQTALIAFNKGVLPKPMGVRLNGVIERDKKMFAFTNYTNTNISDNVTGFTNYTDGFTKVGEMLTYDKVITF